MAASSSPHRSVSLQHSVSLYGKHVKVLQKGQIQILILVYLFIHQHLLLQNSVQPGTLVDI